MITTPYLKDHTKITQCQNLKSSQKKTPGREPYPGVFCLSSLYYSWSDLGVSLLSKRKT